MKSDLKLIIHFKNLIVLFRIIANDVVLSHMVTFLNDKVDKQLRGSFFDCIAGVAGFVGIHCSPILMPLLQQVGNQKCGNCDGLHFFIHFI